MVRQDPDGVAEGAGAGELSLSEVLAVSGAVAPSPRVLVDSDLGANLAFATGTPISVGIRPTTTST